MSMYDSIIDAINEAIETIIGDDEEQEGEEE